MKMLLVALAIVLTGCDTHEIQTAMDDHYDVMVCAGAWEGWKEEKPDCESRRGDLQDDINEMLTPTLRSE